MELVGTRTLDAPRTLVYEALNDPEVLKACIPGCETLEKVSDGEWRAVVATRIGPVSARFNGKVQLTDLNPPEGYTLKFQGEGAGAGFARGEARVTLVENGQGQTDLNYNAKAQVGGKLAQIGSRLIDGAASKLTEEFFSCFAQRVGAVAGTSAPQLPVDAGMDTVARGPHDQREAPGIFSSAKWVGYAALVVIAVILIVMYSRGGFR